MGHRHIYARVNRSDCYVHRCPTGRGWRSHLPPESFAQAPKATASSAIATYGLLRFWAQTKAVGALATTIPKRLQLAGGFDRASGEDCLVSRCDSVVKGASSWGPELTPSQRLWRLELPRWRSPPHR